MMKYAAREVGGSLKCLPTRLTPGTTVISQFKGSFAIAPFANRFLNIFETMPITLGCKSLTAFASHYIFPKQLDLFVRAGNNVSDSVN